MEDIVQTQEMADFLNKYDQKDWPELLAKLSELGLGFVKSLNPNKENIDVNDIYAAFEKLGNNLAESNNSINNMNINQNPEINNNEENPENSQQENFENRKIENSENLPPSDNNNNNLPPNNENNLPPNEENNIPPNEDQNIPPNEENSNNLQPSNNNINLPPSDNNNLNNLSNSNNNYMPPQKNYQYQPSSTMRTDDITNNALAGSGSMNKSQNNDLYNKYSPNKYSDLNTNQAVKGSTSYNYKPYLKNNYDFNSSSSNYTYSSIRRYYCSCCCCYHYYSCYDPCDPCSNLNFNYNYNNLNFDNKGNDFRSNLYNKYSTNFNKYRDPCGDCGF
jgi:hypothetical protein